MSDAVRREAQYRLEDFDYELPKERIAQAPLASRDASRLLVVDRGSGSLQDRQFRDIVDLLNAGEILVLNDTRVYPARLPGKKTTGGKVEALLLGPARDPQVWRVLSRPTLKEGQVVRFSSPEGSETLEATAAGRDGDGVALLRFQTPDVDAFMERHGRTPLPPYVKREPTEDDKARYQTVYARSRGAVAAPTAGLHFTQELLDAIRRKGVSCLFVTLHVGYGTFRPVENIERHVMHSERFELTDAVAGELNRAKRQGRRIWAVGTTVARVLETCVRKGELVAGSGETDLFIIPPFKFEFVNGLITNFHLPRTTLLMLVSAFMGHELMHRAYHHAVNGGYRFYSYGDAMVII